MSSSTVLWYNSPAKAWTQSLPIGNGTLGAMIYGTTSKELLCLNLALQLHHAIHNGFRARGTSGDIDLYGNDFLNAFHHVVT